MFRRSLKDRATEAQPQLNPRTACAERGILLRPEYRYLRKRSRRLSLAGISCIYSGQETAISESVVADYA